MNISLFENHNYFNTNHFTLKSKILTVRLVDIYDGDTCTCILFIFGDYYKYNIRLADIDTCEIKSKNKDIAIKAKNRLFELITQNNICSIDNISNKGIKDFLNKNVYELNILCGDFDKYGRLLAWLYSSNDLCDNINNSYNYILIYEKLAYKYDGGRKLTDEEQLLLLT